MFKNFVLMLMERKVKKYFKKHHPKLVVVVGSVGKTSTKMAIATVLAEKYRVRTHDGNHNMNVSVPPALLGIEFPEKVHSIKAWRTVLKAMDIRIREEADVDVIVQELGTDHIGDIPYFKKYLRPDVAVVTAISDEHMENFPSLDDVAKEELSVASFSKLTVVNDDDVDTKYAKYANTTNIDTYGLNENSEYRLVLQPADPLDGRMGKIIAPEWGELPVALQLFGNQSLKAAAAAACVAAKLGLSAEQTAVGISKIRPSKGRMNVFKGQKNTTIIDDTYNASPLAVKAALETLYQTDAAQRIAILGSMNELGQSSAASHKAIGALCDPMKLEWVVTIGSDAAKYLAPEAKHHGCEVKSFSSPYLAGGFVHSVLRPGGVVLAKGSQNGVFAEEAVKILLHNIEDEDQLVRQGEYWEGVKERAFDEFPDVDS